jgi:hypothetical protein
MINILGNESTSYQPIDHKNNDKLDNTRTNLRIATHSENVRNRRKQKNTLSQYVGVSFSKDKNKWQMNIRINDDLSIYAVYDDETHAAWHYNLMIDKFEINFAKKNNINKPENFMLYIDKPKKDLPKYIDVNGGKFRVRINKKHIGLYDTLEDATIALEKIKTNNKEIKNAKDMSIPILYDKMGQCIFRIKNTEILIDEELYHSIIKYKCNITSQEYIQSSSNGKTIKLHRYIMDNYTGNDVVDHIDGNKLNNTRKNLRIITRAQNAMNKKKALGGSSQYIGVSWFDNRWIASIW